EVQLRKKRIGIKAKEAGLPLVPEEYALPIDKGEVISQFISYAIGVFVGRYRLDKPGLHIAHPNPSQAELEEYLVIRDQGLGAIEQEAILAYRNNQYEPVESLAEVNESTNE